MTYSDIFEKLIKENKKIVHNDREPRYENALDEKVTEMIKEISISNFLTWIKDYVCLKIVEKYFYDLNTSYGYFYRSNNKYILKQINE